MIVIVTGGRDFVNVPLLWETLDKIHDRTPITFLIEGASDDVAGPYKGADFWAYMWARANEVGHHRYHANWKKYGKSAGPIRNKAMMKAFPPSKVVAFPGSNGTADMVRCARAANVTVIEIDG